MTQNENAPCEEEHQNLNELILNGRLIVSTARDVPPDDQANAEKKKTGDLGERIAFKYFSEKYGEPFVKLVNKDGESGKPYDIVIEKDNHKQYVEVKSTNCLGRDWFHISHKEWTLAASIHQEKKRAASEGASYSIAYVEIVRRGVANIKVFDDPFKLYKEGSLQWVLKMPDNQEFETYEYDPKSITF